MFHISPAKFLLFLLAVTAVLIFMHFLYIFHGDADSWLTIFDLDGERNIPSKISSLFILICSFQLMYISNIKNEEHLHSIPWAFLASIFLLLSIDEGFNIHERFESYVWIIPYSIGLAVIVVLFLIYHVKFEKGILILFIMSAVIYIVGQLGLDLYGKTVEMLLGTNTVKYKIIVLFEETCELVGISFFCYAILKHINYLKK